jgi:hypothetical protein
MALESVLDLELMDSVPNQSKPLLAASARKSAGVSGVRPEHRRQPLPWSMRL